MCERGYLKHPVDFMKSLYYRTMTILSIGEDLTVEIYINLEMHQSCNITPTLFNIYIDDGVRGWKLRVDPEIKINNIIIEIHEHNVVCG